MISIFAHLEISIFYLTFHTPFSSILALEMNQKSPFSDQEAKDKKMIDKGIIEAKREIGAKNFEVAKTKLSQISPASRRLGYKQYDVAILYSFLMTKQEKWEEAKPYIQSAARFQPDDPIPWKLLIQVEDKIGTNESLKQTIKRALETCQPDGSLLITAGPFIKKFDDESLTDEYIRRIEMAPNGFDLPIAQFIPENPKTVEIRTKILERKAKSDETSCSDLIHVLLNEGNPFQAKKYAEMLPIDHPDRIYVDALIGDDPVGSARKHLQITGSNIFQRFIEAVDSSDLQHIRNEISLIPSFASGWIYFASKVTDLKLKTVVLSDAIARFPQQISFVRMLADTKEESGDIDGAISTITGSIMPRDKKLGSEMLIKLYVHQHRCKEAEQLLQNDKTLIVSDTERAIIEMELFKEDHDINRLKHIINDYPEVPELAGIKAESAWELRNEIGDDCERLFALSLKCDRNNGKCYLLFGKWQLSYRHDEQKALFLFEKAAEFNVFDNESVQLITKKEITQNNLDKALNLLSKIDNDWSHFRAALIHQRLGNHEQAAREFQIDLRYNPNNIIGWQALGHEYIILGRAMAAESVASYLRNELKQPDYSLELELSSLFGRPLIIDKQNLEFEINPIPFYALLQSKLDTIRNLRRLGRNESALIISSQLKPSIDSYLKKWGSLATVLKICGDFYLDSFLMTNSDDDSQKSFQCYKKRCEIEKRAESFIDLARSFQIQNKIEESIAMLKKVLKVFPTHAGLWTALGISFSFVSLFPFARHCLCVAAKLSTDIEQARSYACCANIGLLIDDVDLLHEAVEAARQSNPYDPDVWQIIAATEKIKTVDSSLIAFQFGASNKVLKNLPDLLLKSGKPYQALGYAMIISDNESISKAFESLGRYDLALLYENDQERKLKLSCLVNSVDHNQFPNWCLYQEGKFDEAANMFMKNEDSYSQIAAAICFAKTGNVEKALSIFLQQRELINGPQIERIMLQVLPKKLEFELKFVNKNPELFFIDQLRSNSRFEAAKKLIQRFPSDTAAMEIYIVEALKSKDEGAVDDNVLTKSRVLYLAKPCLKSLVLMAICSYKAASKEEALHDLQLICLMKPNFAPKLIPIIQKLAA